MPFRGGARGRGRGRGRGRSRGRERGRGWGAERRGRVTWAVDRDREHERSGGRKAEPTSLFDDSSSDDDGGGGGAGSGMGNGSSGGGGSGGGFKINEAYAKRFEDRARRRALWEAKQRGIMAMVDGAGGSDESSSESEDEGEQLTPALDVEILRTIQMIREKNPRIYDHGTVFYRTQAGAGDGEAAAEKQQASKKSKKKPVRAADVLREQILEAAATGKSDAFAEDEGMNIGGVPRNQSQSRVPAYDQEQRKLRQAFTAKVAEAFDEGDTPKGKRATSRRDGAGSGDGNEEGDGADSDDDDDDNLFAVKVKSQADVDRDAKDFDSFLQSDAGKAVKLQMEQDEQEALQRFFTTKTDDANEQFLRDYVLQRKWQGENNGGLPSYEDIVAQDDDDAQALKKADTFESVYNFRYEEENGATIVSYARDVQGSLRRKDDKRKRTREARRLRKERERKERDEEVKRLKNMKLEELRQQMSQVADAAGTELGLKPEDMDGDFDPEEHDRQMARLFNDDYYEGEEAEAGEEGWEVGLGKRPDWAVVDDIVGEDDGAGQAASNGGEAASGGAGDDGEEDVEMTDEHRAIAKQLAALPRTADGDVDVDAVLAKYDFEDVVGGMKTRFKYREVPAADYGLQTEEILAADDKALNRYLPLRRLAPYRDSEWVVLSKHKRTGLFKLRSEIKASLAASDPEKARKKAKKKAKREKRKREAAQAEAASADAEAGTAAPAVVDAASQPPKRKKKRRSRKKDKAAAAAVPPAPVPEPSAPKVSAAKARRLRKARLKQQKQQQAQQQQQQQAQQQQQQQQQAQQQQGEEAGQAVDHSDDVQAPSTKVEEAEAAEGAADASGADTASAKKKQKKMKKKKKKKKKLKKEAATASGGAGESSSGLSAARLSSYAMPTLRKASGLETKGKAGRAAGPRRTPLNE